MNNSIKPMCGIWKRLAGVLALAMLTIVAQAEVVNENPPPDPECTEQHCTSTPCCPTGAISFTNIFIWPDSPMCMGYFYASAETDSTSNNVVTHCWWDNATTNCPDTYYTNTYWPFFTTNWWVLDVGDFHAEGEGLGVSLYLTNCGEGTITFYGIYGNWDVCNPTNPPCGLTQIQKQQSFKVVNVDIAEETKVTCVGGTTSFTLTNTCFDVTWEIVTNETPGAPTIDGGTVTAGTNCGTWTVIARSTENTNCVDSATVKIVGVDSSSASGAKELDDGDNNPKTKLYVACKGTGDITVTATPCPNMAEADLPDCWETTGGTGTNKLTRTVTKTNCALTTITFKAGTSSNVVKVIVFEMKLLTPDGDPVAAPKDSGDGQNEFTFDSATPGVLTVPVKVSVCPDEAIVRTLLQGKIKATIGTVGGSVRAWDNPDPGDTNVGIAVYNAGAWIATATYTWLPTNNGDFGLKSVTVTETNAGCLNKTAQFEVFFPKTEKNHPNPESGVSPNWYYYWKQTTANKVSGTMIYTNIARSNFDYFDGKKVKLGNDAAGTQIAAWGTPKGIDCFAWTTAHEGKHHNQLTGFWPTNWVGTNDVDSDWLPNGQEATYMAPRTYIQTNAATFPDAIGYGQNPIPDAEDIDMRSQASPFGLDPLWKNGDADTVDWANPGKQTKTKF